MAKTGHTKTPYNAYSKNMHTFTTNIVHKIFGLVFLAFSSTEKELTSDARTVSREGATLLAPPLDQSSYSFEVGVLVVY